jgi:transcriptional regulator with XRE-family HTH domain
MAAPSETPEEMEAALGERLRTLRLTRNLDQRTLAERAGVSLKTLRNLELGNGSSLSTLMRVLRALGREEWLHGVAPVATIHPLALNRQDAPRQRSSKRRGPAPTPGASG